MANVTDGISFPISAQDLSTEVVKRVVAVLDNFEQKVKTVSSQAQSHWQALGVRSAAVLREQISQITQHAAALQAVSSKNARDMEAIEAAKVTKIKALNNELYATQIKKAEEAKAAQTALWGNLGIRSVAEIEKQKAAVISSFNTISGTVQKGSQDWINIERAKNEKLKALNKELVGDHEMSMAAMMRAVLRLYAAYYVISQAASVLVQPFIKGFQAVETYEQAVASMAAMVVSFSDSEGMNIEEHWEKALAYSKELIPVLEEIAARTLLSGQETTALANAFARSGTFLDASNAAAVEGFTRISNALPLMTQGQAIMRQINTEIRSVMTGAGEQSSMLLTNLRQIDHEFDKNLATAKNLGQEFAYIGGLLNGFGPATALLEAQWTAVKSTLDTTVTQILRTGMQNAYRDIISYTQTLNKFSKEHSDIISYAVKGAWEAVRNVLKFVGGFLEGINRSTSDQPGIISDIAYGWGGVLAALQPLGKFLGNSIALSYELVKMLINGGKAIFSYATFQISAAEEYERKIDQGWEQVQKISVDNRKLLVEDSLFALEEYANRVAKEKELKKAGGYTPSAISQTPEEVIKLNDQILKDLERRTLTEIELAKRAYQERKDRGADEITNNLLLAAELEEIQKRSAKKQIDNHQSKLDTLNEQIREQMAKAALSEREQIEWQANEWRKLKANEVVVAEWTTAKLLELDEKERTARAQMEEKADEDFRKLMANEYDFAATENERAINRIIAAENEKYVKLRELYQQSSMTYAEIEAAKVQIHKNAVAAILERETQATKKRNDDNYNLIKGIEGLEQQAYEARLQQIKDEAIEFERLGYKEAYIAVWVANERTKASEDAKIKMISDYQEIWNKINELNGGEGVGMMTSSMQGIAESSAGLDQYSKEINAANERYRAIEEAARGHEDYMNQITAAAAARDEVIEQASANKRVMMSKNMAGLMAGIMYSLYEATGKRSLAMFRMYQAAAIAETIISTYDAAQKSYAWGAKFGGPPLGAVMAAVAVAAGMARVQAIASQQIGGGISSVGESGSGGGYGGAQTEPSWQPAVAPAKAAPVVTIIVYGNIVDQDAFAREMVPSITKALEDGAH